MSVLSKTVGSKVNAGLQLGFLIDNIAENTDLVSSVCAKNLVIDAKEAVENCSVLQGKMVQIQAGGPHSGRRHWNHKRINSGYCAFSMRNDSRIVL